MYETAIRKVCELIAPYDKDGKIPVYGFGGIPKFMGEDQVNDCFPLNGKPDPFIVGLDNIINTYKNCIAEIGIAKPARFASILRTFKTYVEKDIKGQNSYGVLLILTDGYAEDMK